VITATVSDEGRRLDGAWRKRRNADEWPELLFHATSGAAPRFAGTSEDAPSAGSERVAGRWSVRFAGDAEPAVGEFHIVAGGEARGTFLTTTGDHRFLAGRIDREQPGPGSLLTRDDGTARFGLRLSCFDGTLAGDFWSGGRFHDTWTAVRDEHAALPDAFSLTRAMPGGNANELVFPDLEGQPRKLSEPEFAGKLRVIEIFGSWCPNCADEAAELAELQAKYGPRGLKIVGLAFELTGERARDAELVRRYAARHGANWPMLLAGVQDRKKASTALAGVIDELRAWPTTLFVDPAGKVRAVYTGWSGPATGEANAQQRAQIEKLIESLFAE
jgi:thiol-disulfide isomerase/thioredoxin